ncbi:MAG: YifB family Mg chelatase-like AAA ATPase [Myxococcaceae bacterium]|nr:YifB family Mg chelatase-like AAA ATPase [Myxococcaceae bacterium]
MLARVRSGSVVGVDAVVVEVEVDMSLGLPFFNVVGLPEGAVKESKVRVVSALKNSGFELPQKRITVNLAPADIRKEGATFELPIALGVLVAAQQLPPEPLGEYLFGGELSLDGAVKPIRGVLPLAIAARDGGYRGVIVPVANAAEAALVDRIEVIPVRDVVEAVRHLSGEEPLTPFDREAAVRRPAGDGVVLDMTDVRGQGDMKSALELAAAGGHNLLMCGPPGSGKTMLARRLPSILPPLEFQEALELTKLYSVMGLVKEGEALVSDRPFRAPHHTISDAGLVGGGPLARPGELSMAHRGVLFLDELPEFRKNVLEVLRQPLEEGLVRLARANQHITYPCRVMLVAAMNPCPCGWFNVQQRQCLCAPNRVNDYHARISGPLLDRIDITLETRPVELRKLAQADGDERPSSYYRERVMAARARQLARFRNEPGVFCNAQMGPRLVRRYCLLGAAGQAMLEGAVQRYGLSARAHDRILKLALTRADLEQHERITDDDVMSAISCRVIDRKDWIRRGQTAAGVPYVDPRQQALIHGGGR